MRQKLTVIVPCKNERTNIRACIESFYAIADEVLIADSGSTDGTREIAEKFNRVRVIEREYVFSGDFKNWAIPQARNDWVMIVDADERVTWQLAAEIWEVLSEMPKHDGYWINRNNHFFGRRLYFGDARTDGVIRLFKRDLGSYVGPSDHGEIEILTERVGKLKNSFDHFSVWDYDAYFRKFHRYTTFQAQQWHDDGKDTSSFKLLVRPMFRFFREWILQGSILDGKVGLQTAWMAAMYSFMKQARLWELNHAVAPPRFDEDEQFEQSIDDSDSASGSAPGDSDDTSAPVDNYRAAA